MEAMDALAAMAHDLLRGTDDASNEERAVFQALWFAGSHRSYTAFQALLLCMFGAWTLSSPCHYSIGTVLCLTTAIFVFLRPCVACFVNQSWARPVFIRVFYLAFLVVMPCLLTKIMMTEHDPEHGFCPIDTPHDHVTAAWLYTSTLYCLANPVFIILIVIVYRTPASLERLGLGIIIVAHLGFDMYLYATTHSLFAKKLQYVLLVITLSHCGSVVGLFSALALTRDKAAAVNVHAREFLDAQSALGPVNDSGMMSTSVVKEESASTVDTRECVVCLDDEQSHACIPCGHLCLCSGCAENLHEAGKAGRCPICQRMCSHIVAIRSV